MLENKKELTARKKQAIETKKRILNVGRKLIIKNGYNNVTVDEISKASNITVGTFYYYFKGKDELIVGMFPSVESYYAKNKDIEKEPYIRLIDYFSYFNAEIEEKLPPEIVLQLFNSSKALSMLDEDRIIPGIEIIIEGQIKGQISKKYLPAYISKVLFSLSRGICLHWAMHQNSIKLGETTKDVVKRVTYTFLTGEYRNKYNILDE